MEEAAMFQSCRGDDTSRSGPQSIGRPHAANHNTTIHIYLLHSLGVRDLQK